MVSSFGRLRAGFVWGAACLAVAGAAVVGAPTSKAQDGGAAVPPIGPRHHHHPFQWAVYEPQLLDQQARVAARCLGVRPHPRRHGSVVRFHIELHNTTDEELELDDDSLLLDWAREKRTPERAVEPESVRGRTELEPGEASRVRVRFFVREDEPNEVYLLRLQWAVRSDLGTRVLLRSVFERSRAGYGPPGRFHFVPGYDPYGRFGLRPGWP